MLQKVPSAKPWDQQGWVEGGVFTHDCPPISAHQLIPQTPVAGGWVEERRGRSLPRPSEHHSGTMSPGGPQAAEVLSKQPGRGAF